MKEIWKIVAAIVASMNQTLLWLGVILFGLGAAGGIRYSQWFVIDDQVKQIVMMVAGALLVVAALLRSNEHGPKSLKQGDIDALQIKILAPRPGQEVDAKVKVEISSSKPIPDGYQLMVLRGYPRLDGVVPNAALSKSPTALEWTAHSFDLAGKAGEERKVEVWLVGRDGQALLESWRENHEVVSELNRNIRTLGANLKEGADLDAEDMRKWLPPITKRTADMHCCQAVTVRRK